MEQLDFFDIPSPCVGICTVDDKGYCKGCMRNRQERFGWLTMTQEEKKRVIRLCRQRYRRKIAQQRSQTPDNPMMPPANPQQTLF